MLVSTTAANAAYVIGYYTERGYKLQTCEYMGGSALLTFAR